MSVMSLALTSFCRRPLPVPVMTISPRLPEAERVSNTVSPPETFGAMMFSLMLNLSLTNLANQPDFCRPWLLARESKTSTVISEPSSLVSASLLPPHAATENSVAAATPAASTVVSFFLSSIAETSLYPFLLIFSYEAKCLVGPDRIITVVSGPAITDSRYTRDPTPPSLGTTALTQAEPMNSPQDCSLTAQPLTAPSIMPLTKKRWKNG